MKITPEMIEAGAKAIRCLMVAEIIRTDSDFVVVEWDQLPDMARENYRYLAFGALNGALPQDQK